MELLDQEPTLSSGMFRVNELTLFIFLGVDVTWQIQHIISILVFNFLGVPRSFGFPLKLSLSYSQGFPESSWLGFPLLFPTGVPSPGFMSGWLVLATPEPILFFTIGIFGG